MNHARPNSLLYPVSSTLLLPCSTTEELYLAVTAACREFRAGLPVALPTETVYGLAADALNTEAVLKIFEAKQRPFFDPLIVHLPTLEWLGRVTDVPEGDAALVQALTAHFWPGPLTLVLPKREVIPDLVASGLPTVAVRMSAHPVFKAVVEAFASPLAAPSANRFGRISPTAAPHVMSELASVIPLVLDGGETAHGVESTIVAVAGGRMEILRSGPVTREQLAEFGDVTAAGVVAKPVAPGQLKSHYAPLTPLRLLQVGAELKAAVGKRCGLLAWQHLPPPEAMFEKVEVLSPQGNLREGAKHLFAAMRRLDEAGLDLIFAEPVPEHGLGVAMMDRLRKASYAEEARGEV